MIEPNIYCVCSGMAMRCIADFYEENGRLPVVLEIGCAEGDGTMRYAGFCSFVICVDPMVSQRPDIFTTSEKDVELVQPDQQKIDIFHNRTREFDVRLVMGPSLWQSTFDRVHELLEGRTVDVLIVDGCHHPFEAVWGDFEKYVPLVTGNGFVVVDDIYEPCIKEARDKAVAELGLVHHREWWAKDMNSRRQAVEALRKVS